MDFERKKIKKYFVGKGIALAVIGIIAGLFLIAMSVEEEEGSVAIVGVVIMLSAIAWIVYAKLLPDIAGEKEVDKAIAYEIAEAKKRAYIKLNLIVEQVQDVRPVVVSGRGYAPTGTATAMAKLGLLKRIIVKIINRKDEDPVYRIKIGSDDVVRCSLLKVTIFMFGEKQLYIYFANVDLCTGFVYAEGTNEIFYSDISGLSFVQLRERVFNSRKFKFQRVLFEGIEVFANGCNYQASLSTSMHRSMIDAEFAGMRTLIRERKNAD